MAEPDYEVAIVGAGPGGIATAKHNVVNSQRDTVYHRPRTITGSRRFSRHSPLTDYEFHHRRAGSTEPAPHAEEMSA